MLKLYTAILSIEIIDKDAIASPKSLREIQKIDENGQKWR
jgi:hypothetical protein